MHGGARRIPPGEIPFVLPCGTYRAEITSIRQTRIDGGLPAGLPLFLVLDSSLDPFHQRVAFSSFLRCWSVFGSRTGSVIRQVILPLRGGSSNAPGSQSM